MPQALVSIIVPVYNAAPFLERCIRSVLHQTLADIEVIAINDGSSDESGLLLNELAKGDPRLRVFHQNNQGASAARNLGLLQANGKYIGFVDADDWIDPNFYERLVNALEDWRGDWTVCNALTETGSTESQERLALAEGVADTSQYKTTEIKNLLRFKYDYANWNKLFAGSVIRDNGLRFEPAMVLWEDLLFNLIYLQFAKKLVIVDQALYHYRVHPASITKTSQDQTIAQFNLLYQQYRAFTAEHKLTSEWRIFKQEMARSCYYQLIDQIAKTEYRNANSALAFFVRFRKSIKAFTPGVFYFRPEALQGIQGLKKILLMKKQYFLFSLFITFSVFSKRNKRHMHG